MTTGQTGIVGQPPTLRVEPSPRAVYERMWEQPEYRAVAPGERHVERFLAQAKPAPGDDVIDFGCGTGRAAVLLNSQKLNVTMLDFAANCLDDYVRRLAEKYPDSLHFVRHDLTKWPLPVKRAKFGFCCDVLEHIPPQDVERTLWNILRGARHVFLAISTRPDAGLGGEPLHLTVEPFDWWKAKLEAMKFAIAWSEETPDTALFYGSAYASARDLYDAMVLNTEEEVLQAQILANLRLGLPEIAPHELQPDAEVILLAGGPSLNDFAEEIYERAKAGVPVVTLNGTYNWALAHRIRPASTVVLDARPFNARFVQPVVEGCKYFISSQCHADVVTAIPRDQIWLWHSGNAPKVREAIDAWAAETGQHRQWWPVYGGSTVALRAIVLLRMLGFAKQHIYGLDSCLAEDGAHHAYAQPENDRVNATTVEVGGRTFTCHAWMWAQAQEFMDLMRGMDPTDLQVEVYGDGLIAQIIRTAAEQPVPPGAEPKRFFIVDSQET